METLVDGIFLNIDNSLLTECQKAANEAMVRVCGDTANCDNLAVNKEVGTRSFKYEVCEFKGFDSQNVPKWTGNCKESLDGISLQELKEKDWAGKVSGLVYWGAIEYDPEGNKFTSAEEYMQKLRTQGHVLDDEQVSIIKDRIFGIEISGMAKSVEAAINAIESDPKVEYCMKGRTFQGLRNGKDGKINMLGNRSEEEARFPNLTMQMRQIIAQSAYNQAKDNYKVKYDIEMERLMKDQSKAAAKIDADHRTESARKVCADWAKNSTLPESDAPKVSAVGMWIAVGVVAVVAVVASVFTFGGAAFAGAAAITAMVGTSVTTGMVTAAATATAIAAGVAGAGLLVGASVEESKLAKEEINNWNYKSTVTTSFNEVTGVCTKTTVTQNCAKTKKNYCKEWEDPKESQTSINLLD